MTKITTKHIQDWLAFFSKYMHLLTPEQEETMMVDMIGGKKPPENFKPEDIKNVDVREARKHISSVVKKYREASGMKAAEFGKAIGHSAAYVSLVENGKRCLNIVDLQKAMKILKIPQEEIFTILHS